MSCRLGGCGNGRLEAGESCDDGNGSNSDFCLNDCTAAFCGDGFVNPATEQCDPNNSPSEASCEAGCHETDGCEDDGSECATYLPVVSEELLDTLHAKGIEVHARPKPEAVYSVNINGAPFIGAKDAKVTIVEAFEFA